MVNKINWIYIYLVLMILLNKIWLNFQLKENNFVDIMIIVKIWKNWINIFSYFYQDMNYWKRKFLIKMIMNYNKI